MPKTVVTHINPDLDAIAAVWLLLRFGGREFQDANISFVPAGERLEEAGEDTVHVDTGLGEFDHHQSDKKLKDVCAATRVYLWLVDSGRVKDQEALRRLLSVVNDVDHFRECLWPEPLADRYEFFLEPILDGLKSGNYFRSDTELVEMGMRCLDGVLASLKRKIQAEAVVKSGIAFQTRWGKAIAFESGNDTAMKLALKSDFAVSVRRDKRSGAVRIKALPREGIDLTVVYEKLRRADRGATWFFHPSRLMILNGSTKNPRMRPSRLRLEEVMEILKSV